ncbi:MAG: hypothetical protein ABIL58_08270 [Pseudomonadota bacterium]
MPSTVHAEPVAASTPDAPRVYMCQVSATLSCGACCGLYNVAGLSRETLTDMLRERTAAFVQVPRTVAGIDAFAERAVGFSPPDRPFPGFHHCPFVGLIDGERRAGCLLHPLAAGNAGIDWRGLSYYGGLACATYFCPSTRQLPAAHLLIVRQAFDSWYDYGLMVTERRLLAAVFERVERLLGRPLAEADAFPSSAIAALLREFSALQRHWPYRRPDAPGPSNYFFENGEYPRAPVNRRDAGIAPSGYDDIFRELESVFASTAELCRAERVLDDIFGCMAPVK